MPAASQISIVSGSTTFKAYVLFSEPKPTSALASRLLNRDTAARMKHPVAELGVLKNQITNLPTCWRAPDPPVRRTNQNRLVGPSNVPNPQFWAAWKTQWHNAGLIKFANFQIAIFRRELDG
jgi:hypothetical protein